MILVDASSSMWDNMYWDALCDAVLGAVHQLQSEVRLGLATFGGAGATCPLELHDSGPIALDNYQQISEFYTAIMRPNAAVQTPTPAAIHTVRESLLADSITGQVAILLVTDGNPNFCDNGQSECRADATVRVIQDTHQAGIDVLLAALPDPGINQDWLTAFANAGLGQPVSPPQDTQFCSSLPGPTAELLSDIDPNSWPMGEYGDTMGPVLPIPLDGDDVSAMTEAIVDSIDSWSACP